MQFYENRWHYITFNGNQMNSMKINENLWKPMKFNTNHWKSMKTMNFNENRKSIQFNSTQIKSKSNKIKSNQFKLKQFNFNQNKSNQISSNPLLRLKHLFGVFRLSHVMFYVMLCVMLYYMVCYGWRAHRFVDIIWRLRSSGLSHGTLWWPFAFYSKRQLKHALRTIIANLMLLRLKSFIISNFSDIRYFRAQQG